MRSLGNLITIIATIIVVATLVLNVNANSTSLCLSGAVPLVLSTECAPGWYLLLPTVGVGVASLAQYIRHIGTVHITMRVIQVRIQSCVHQPMNV
jgi:hypothetical protein